MDILSHTLTGIAVGTLTSTFVRTSRYSIKKKCLIIFSGALAGALPDIDAISLWSGFDGSIGKFFGLSNSGRAIYSGKKWYSHHGMMHSLFIGVLVPLLWWFIGGLISRNRLQLGSRLKTRWHKGKLGMLTFFMAYAFHCVEDMITPSGSWGGVRLFFPSQEYYGGWGKIWWWNNYDLFLIILLVVVLNLLFHLSKKHRTALASISFIIGIILFNIQILRRSDQSFGWQKNERNSQELQKRFLHPKVYKIVNDFDNSMNLAF